MVDQKLATGSITLVVGYSKEDGGEPAKGTVSFGRDTNADGIVLPLVTDLYERIVDDKKMIRRMYVNCNNVKPEGGNIQLSLFDADVHQDAKKDHQRQEAVLGIHKRYGKNALIKGIDLLAEATARERNHQIGGHKSGE